MAQSIYTPPQVEAPTQSSTGRCDHDTAVPWRKQSSRRFFLDEPGPPHSISAPSLDHLIGHREDSRRNGEAVPLAVSAQPEPQTAFPRSPADIGRGRGSPAEWVPSADRQDLCRKMRTKPRNRGLSRGEPKVRTSEESSANGKWRRPAPPSVACVKFALTDRSDLAGAVGEQYDAEFGRTTTAAFEDHQITVIERPRAYPHQDLLRSGSWSAGIVKFASQLWGELLCADNRGYDAACKVGNALIRQTPGLDRALYRHGHAIECERFARKRSSHVRRRMPANRLCRQVHNQPVADEGHPCRSQGADRADSSRVSPRRIRSTAFPDSSHTWSHVLSDALTMLFLRNVK